MATVTYIEGHEERYAPPVGPQLEVSVFKGETDKDDLIFLRLVRSEETYESSTYRLVDSAAQIGVRFDDLMNALGMVEWRS